MHEEVEYLSSTNLDHQFPYEICFPYYIALQDADEMITELCEVGGRGKWYFDWVETVSDDFSSFRFSDETTGVLFRMLFDGMVGKKCGGRRFKLNRTQNLVKSTEYFH